MSCDVDVMCVDVMCVDVMYVDLSSSLCRLFVAVAVADVVVAVIPWNIIRYNFLL